MSGGRPRRGRFLLKNAGISMAPDLIQRLDTARETIIPGMRLTRSALVELAVVRFLDAVQDNPAHLFAK